MNKPQTSKLLNKIKGYYNSQFFIDDYVIETWSDMMEKYDLEDAEERLIEHLKEYPNQVPKPHTFIKGMLTKEQKEARKNSGYLISCNLCGRWFNLQEYDEHYGKCLDIQYLASIAKQKDENITRKDLENVREEVFNKLMNKYAPKENAKKWLKGVRYENEV